MATTKGSGSHKRRSSNSKRSGAHSRKRGEKRGKPTGDAGIELELDESTWTPVNLGPILAGKQRAEPPSILRREDGVCLLYRGKVHALYGEPEAGKGWVALAATAEQLKAGDRVVYIDFEDDPETAVERLRALGVEDEAIRDRFIYVRPDEPLKPNELSRAALDAALDPPPSLVVIDGMTEALALEGKDLNSNSDVADWIVLLPRRIARVTGAATVVIDHQTKDGDNRGRWAIGAQHKLAGVHVAYSIKVVKPFGRGLAGSSRLSVQKDRPGHVRRSAQERVVAEVRVASEGEDGRVALTVEPPNAGSWQPTEKMEAISAVLEAAKEGLSRTALLQAVEGKAATIDEAIRHLRAEGHVEVEALGSGRRTIHRSLKPYRAPDEGSEK